MPELRFTIPAVPPSANNYVRHIAKMGRNGKPFVQHYVTAAAEQWYWDVASVVQGRQLRGTTYAISFVVFVKTLAGADVDNFCKCIFDGVAKAGCIDNDKHVIDLHGYRRVDRLNPRTEIIVRTDQEQMFEV